MPMRLRGAANYGPFCLLYHLLDSPRSKIRKIFSWLVSLTGGFLFLTHRHIINSSNQERKDREALQEQTFVCRRVHYSAPG